MKKYRSEDVKFSIDLEVVLKHKKQLARLVDELQSATAGAVSPIPNNDFLVNAFSAGFLGDKYKEYHVKMLEESINSNLDQHIITSFDVVPLEVGMMVNPKTETLSLGLDSAISFRTFKLRILSAMQNALEELDCATVRNLSHRDLKELTSRDDTKPRLELAHYRPNRLGINPVVRIIEECYDHTEIEWDNTRPSNPLSLVPSDLAIQGLRLTRHAPEAESGLPPGHAENLEGDYDHTGRLKRKCEYA